MGLLIWLADPGLAISGRVYYLEGQTLKVYYSKLCAARRVTDCARTTLFLAQRCGGVRDDLPLSLSPFPTV
jgi:hypothetical protein